MAQYQVKGNLKESVTSIHCPSMHVQVFKDVPVWNYYFQAAWGKFPHTKYGAELGSNPQDHHIMGQELKEGVLSSYLS